MKKTTTTSPSSSQEFLFFSLGVAVSFCSVLLFSRKQRKLPDRIIVEQSPQFPGDMMEWIVKNLHYPIAAKTDRIEGRVVVHFEVNTKGGVENVTLIEGVCESIDKEALRVINSMPQWLAGKRRKSFSIPINFIIY